MTAAQREALHDFADLMLTDRPIDVTDLWGTSGKLMVDIGFGDGTSTLAWAEAHPTSAILAIDVHTPGVADLLRRVHERELSNVRVIHADAVHVLNKQLPADSVHALQTFFPDPWPKARHHKRRFVRPDIVDLIADRTVIGGTWHIATDWQPYAAAMLEVFARHSHWGAAVIPRPDRPVTHYEQRALRAGRPVIDLAATRAS